MATKKEETKPKSVFGTLNSINVNEHTEKKNNLTYLSWAWAWAEVKKNYPDATYTIYENAEGLFYHHDGKTCWVKTGVTIDGLECIEYLPVMDYRNASIPKDKVTSFDVNKAIQRSLTKAVARHGLGLYIYAGEDLPEEAQEAKKQEELQNKAQEDANFEKDVLDQLDNVKSRGDLDDVCKKSGGYQKLSAFPTILNKLKEVATKYPKV